MIRRTGLAPGSVKPLFQVALHSPSYQVPIRVVAINNKPVANGPEAVTVVEDTPYDFIQVPHALSLSLSHTHTLAPSLSHTHTRPRSLSLTHTPTLSHTHCVCEALKPLE